MSIIHVRQIQAALRETFEPLIDLSDLGTADENQRTQVMLTRSLAAFSVMMSSDISPEQAAASVTDGSDDNGIDALYFHETERMMYVVQAKWHSGGTGTIQRGDAQKFITGFQDLLNARFNRFNTKIQQRQETIESALNDARTRFVVVVAHTGTDDLAEPVTRDFEDLLLELNDPTEVVVFKVLRQASFYNYVAQGMEGAPIDLELVLYEWGQLEEPHRAYYGQVSATDVARWWHQYYPRLFAPNIRLFLGNTTVNEGVVETLAEQPELFWFFNNGITALCDTVAKKPIGGSSRQSGIFECSGFTIVNGAQTAGAIAAAAAQFEDNLEQARVPIRIISLSNTPEDFANDVTRYNNTQNRIERRDFIALDPEQERLRTELLMDGIVYAYKSGESVPDGESGFDLVEATVARACFHDRVNLAVTAKAAIGRLWDDIERAPYQILFNSGVQGRLLWKQVQVLSIVEQVLNTLRRGKQGREKLLAIHGNRFIAHLVAMNFVDVIANVEKDLEQDMEASIEAVTSDVYEAALEAVNELYPDSYLASVFKNVTKCEAIKQYIHS